MWRNWKLWPIWLLTIHVAFGSNPRKCYTPFWVTVTFPLHFSIFEARKVSKLHANVWPTCRRLDNCWCWTTHRNHPNWRKRQAAKSWVKPTIRANCFVTACRSTTVGWTFWFHGRPNSTWILHFWSWKVTKTKLSKNIQTPIF